MKCEPGGPTAAFPRLGNSLTEKTHKGDCSVKRFLVALMVMALTAALAASTVMAGPHGPEPEYRLTR